MRRPDRERLIGTLSAVTDSASLGTEASVYYLPSSQDLAAHPGPLPATGSWRCGGEAAVTVWMALVVRRALLELELANLQLERSRLVLENQVYRSLLGRESAATRRMTTNGG
jgi:hypothetical protein